MHGEFDEDPPQPLRALRERKGDAANFSFPITRGKEREYENQKQEISLGGCISEHVGGVCGVAEPGVGARKDPCRL
jgi:hypothetical protein